MSLTSLSVGAVLERKQSISSMSGAMLSPRRSSRRNLQDDVLNAAAPSVAATQPKFVVYALSPLPCVLSQNFECWC